MSCFLYRFSKPLLFILACNKYTHNYAKLLKKHVEFYAPKKLYSNPTFFITVDIIIIIILPLSSMQTKGNVAAYVVACNRTALN